MFGDRSKVRVFVLGVTLLLALSPFLLDSPAAHAETVVSITTSNGPESCAEYFDGSWSSNNTCLGRWVADPSTRTVNIGAGVTLWVSNMGGGTFVSGTVDNYWTLIGTSLAVKGYLNEGEGIAVQDSGTINNYGVMVGNYTYTDGFDILNYGTINNYGTMTAPDASGFTNGGTINNAGVMRWNSASAGGVANARGVINEYCSNTQFGQAGGTVNYLPCHTVTFDQTGLLQGDWGVSVSWGPFKANVTGTGPSVSLQATGSLNYAVHSPVTSGGVPYACTSGCSGSADVSGPTTFSAAYSSSSVFAVPPPTTTGGGTRGALSGVVPFVAAYGSLVVVVVVAALFVLSWRMHESRHSDGGQDPKDPDAAA